MSKLKEHVFTFTGEQIADAAQARADEQAAKADAAKPALDAAQERIVQAFRDLLDLPAWWAVNDGSVVAAQTAVMPDENGFISLSHSAARGNSPTVPVEIDRSVWADYARKQDAYMRALGAANRMLEEAARYRAVLDDSFVLDADDVEHFGLGKANDAKP